jgi:hypothetical protein
LISNQVTLRANTRLFMIEQKDPAGLQIQAHDLDVQSGAPGNALWRSNLPTPTHGMSQEGHGQRQGTLDAILIGPTQSNNSSSVSGRTHANFEGAWSKRTAILYVATSDGELFSFNADTGQRKPVRISGQRENQLEPTDTSLATAEVVINGEWRTLLVVLSRADQPFLHVIDATDPNDPNLLWSQAVARKFVNQKGSNPRDAGAPVIARVNDRGAVILAVDGALHVYDAATGELLRAIAIESNADSYTAALAVDLDHDGTTDRVYAGDSLGNLWRFDLSQADPDQWQVAFSGLPLFIARSGNGAPVSIHMRPEIALSRDAKTPVLLFTARDDSGISLFGVFDRNTSIKLHTIGSHAGPITDPNQSNVSGDSVSTAWRRDLGARGPESVLFDSTAPLLSDNQLIVLLSKHPSTGCGVDQPHSLLAFSIDEGRLIFEIPLLADNSEVTAGASTHVAHSSVLPAILDQFSASNACARHYYVGSDDTGLIHISRACRSASFGRQSWRQLR